MRWWSYGRLSSAWSPVALALLVLVVSLLSYLRLDLAVSRLYQSSAMSPPTPLPPSPLTAPFSCSALPSRAAELLCLTRGVEALVEHSNGSQSVVAYPPSSYLRFLAQQSSVLHPPVDVVHSRFGCTCTLGAYDPAHPVQCEAQTQLDERWPAHEERVRSQFALEAAAVEYPYPEVEEERGCGDGVVALSDGAHPWYYYDLVSCLHLSRQLTAQHRLCQPSGGPPVYFHLYFIVPGEQWPEQAVYAVVSFLATQDLSQSHLIVWSDREWTADTLPLLLSTLLMDSVLGSAFSFRRWDAEEELSHTPLASLSSSLGLKDARDEKHWTDSDLFRLLVLYSYGGVYFDADVLWTRDLSPVLGAEFVYKWGTECSYFNGAVARFFRHSVHLAALLQLLPHRPPGGINWGALLYSEYWQAQERAGQPPPFTAFPACFFNPTWLTWSLGDSVRKRTADRRPSFYAGPFAVHLHGQVLQSGSTPHNDSDYRLLQRRMRNAVDRRRKKPQGSLMAR